MALEMGAEDSKVISVKDLVFGCPTYLLYALQQVAVPYPFLALLGLASFTAGLFLFTRLMKGKE